MFGNAAAYTLSEPLLDGDAGTAQTVAWIRRLVEQGKKDRRIIETTGKILRESRVRQYDDEAEIRAIFSWVLRNIRFTKDPTGKELLRDAWTTLRNGFGDCDDINAILLPAMLGSVGHETRIVTIASAPGAPQQFTHVYAEAYLRGRGWIALDAARRGTRFGVPPARFFRKRAWELDSNEYQDIRGMGCANCAGDCARCSMRRRAMLGTHYRLGAQPAANVIYTRRYRASGLGQFDWGSFTDIANSIGKATTSIITAARAPAGVVYPAMSVYPPVGPPAIPPGGGVSAIGTVSSNTMLFGALALVGVVLLARR
jgi:Transglutaminase-like superfamily